MATLRGLLPAVIILCVTALAGFSGLLAPADRLASDLRTWVLAGPAETDVVIVAIDAHSLRALNRWPWSRNIHGELLHRLVAAQPKAVFFDIDFSVPSGDPAADAALASALARHRTFPVVLPAFWQNANASTRESRVLTEPGPLLSARADVGLVNISPGADGLVRDAVHRDRFGTRDYRSVGAVLTERRELEPGRAYPIDFRISPASFTYVSYADVLSGEVPARVLTNKTVFVGATAVELGDTLPVPVYRAIPGVALQATIYQTLRQGIPVILPTWIALLATLGLVLLWIPLRQRGWRAQLALLVAAAAGLTGLSLYLHARHNVLVDVAMPLSAITLCLFAGVVASADRQTLLAVLARLRLKHEQALISGVFSASIDGILVLDAAARIRDANRSAATLFGVKRSAMMGRAARVFLPELRVDEQGLPKPGRFELRARTPDGACPVEVSVSPADAAADGMLTVIVRDVRERHRQQAVLRHQATHDPLTGLPNRTLLTRLLERLPQGGNAALFMLDLDGFKKVNDTLGHGVGDQVLRILGKRLRQALPSEVRVFRIGGDEFAVLVSRYTRRTELLRLAEQLVSRVRAPVAAGTNQVEIGGSVGIALYPEHASTGAALLQCADVAMYSAKADHGGARFYDAKADHNTLRNLKMTGALRRAIEADALTMVYQPKVRLSDGTCCGVEALVRWTDPDLGMVSPAEFVPLAETCDLIVPLTRMTLDRAVRDQARWCARGIDVGVAVNLSARHLTDMDFAGEIIRIIRERGLDPGDLELEITETALMENPDQARSVLGRLTAQGIRLAMDDFGTGFSSLAYLKHLNLHTLKIDRCFIQDLTRSHSDRKIVESTLSMAHSLDLEVVAEGVEDDDQAALLKKLGCDVGQGYGFAKPMPADEFIAWYHNRQPARAPLKSASA